MASLTDFAEEKIQKHVHGIAAYAAPATLYLGLSTADPGETGSGLAEPLGNAYARVAITSTLVWNATLKRIENNATITLPTATGSWGTATHFGWFDALTAGNLIAKGALPTAKAYAAGDVCSFAAADVTLSMTGAYTEYAREKILKHLCNIAAFTQPALYVVLSTADPGATGAGLAEPVGNAYTRQLVAAAGWQWNAGQQWVENVAAIQWAIATGNWGTVTHDGLADAATAGNLILSTALTASKAYNTGDRATLPAGEFSNALD